MGTMSASDATPLPRLGEVFFDVRGSARSMRLSWYADTGVAVFSIWQAGTCTGTFRLPMGDLPRMIETLRRGPGGRPAPDPAAREPGYDGEAGYAAQAWPDPEPDPGPATQAWPAPGRGYAPEPGDAADARYAASAPGFGWERPDPAPPGYPAGEGGWGYPAGPAAPAYNGGHSAEYGADYRTEYAAEYRDDYSGGHRGDFADERAQAHYLPAPAGAGDEPESDGRATVSRAYNGETVPGPGARGRPPESFSCGPPAAGEP